MIPGRVLVSYGSHGLVSTDQGVFDCRWRRSAGRPFCGDKVEISRQANGEAALESISPRHSEFQRGDRRGRPQTIAANVEQVAVVVAPVPAPSEFVIDRYLVAIQAMQLRPLLVLNKVDLLDQAPNLTARLDEYRSLGVPLITTSTKGPPGTTGLRDALHQRVSVLVGQSGVGKSSLVNTLIPDREEQTGALSDATGKGRHTTTRTLWIQLPHGGAVIDSPGVWEYGLWHMPEEQIANSFTDFAPYLGQCRFRNCQHRGEPGCAIQQAVDQGEITQRRFAAYHNILNMQAETA